MESIFSRYRQVVWLKDLTESGASFARSEPQKRNIIFTNGLALGTSFAFTILMVFHRLFTSPQPSVRDWLYLGVFLFILPIGFNRQGFTRASRLAVCWLPPL